MLYEDLLGMDHGPVMGQISTEIKSRGGDVSVAYGVAALELLRMELGVEGGYGKVIEAVQASGALPTFTCDYLNASLKVSGLVEDEALEGLDAELVRSFLSHGLAGAPAEARVSTTQLRVAKLAAVLLEIGPGCRVADYGCGQGIFLCFVAAHRQDVSCVGYEIDPARCAVATLRAHALGLDDAIEVRCEDVLGIPETGERFDAIFSNYPVGLRLPRVHGAGPWLKEVASGGRPYGSPVTFDWVFNQLMVDTLTDGGVAVAITGEGALTNVSDEPVRKCFIENGLVAEVISLPSGSVAGNNVEASMLVLGHAGSDPRMFLFPDASEPSHSRYGWDDDEERPPREALDDESIYDIASEVVRSRKILDSWGLMPPYSGCVKVHMSVDVSVLPEEHYRLAEEYYFGDDDEEGYWEELSEYVTYISRGVTLKAADLNAMTVSYDSGVRYLPPTGIEDGMIQVETLPFLAELTPKLEKHLLRAGDFLISRIGSPYRFAVAVVEEDDQIIASSNLFVVRLTEDLDPYYLAAFLSSPKGQRQLELASSGSSVPSISAQTFKEICIDTDPMWDGDVAESYREKLAEIRDLKTRLAQARNDIAKLLD